MATIWFNYLEVQKNYGKKFSDVQCVNHPLLQNFVYIFCRCSKYFYPDKHVGVTFVDIVIYG
jgi:hypothetical protein